RGIDFTRSRGSMSAAVLKDLMARRPFEPFRVRLSSGDAYEVRHPEMALLLRNGIYVAIANGGNDLPDQAVWCSLLHVAAVEPLAAGRGNQGAGSSDARTRVASHSPDRALPKVDRSDLCKLRPKSRPRSRSHPATGQLQRSFRFCHNCPARNSPPIP